MSSTGALELQKVPEKMIVIGAGVIGLEMGSVWSRLGAKVEVVEFLTSVGGAGIDGEIAKSFKKTLEKQGLKFRMGTKVGGRREEGRQGAAQRRGRQERRKVAADADVVLVAIGRRPVTNGLNLEAIGVEKDERGRIIVDDQYNTTCKGVKCIGDATFAPCLRTRPRRRASLPSRSSRRATATSTTLPSPR